MQLNRNKVIVVGLDGATFSLLQPLMDQGKMPRLKQIVENGVSGILNSTIPPVTAPAWLSFATGKNPGKHGIYDFIVRDKNNNEVVVNSRLSKGREIWKILGDYNKKVGIINFPISYPPDKVNGFMISGFISPLNAKDYFYPADLHAQILKEAGDYIINVKAMPTKWREYTIGEIKKFIDKLLYLTELRYKTFKYLMRSKEWDFLYILFMSFDKLQHSLWKYLDSNDPRYDPKGEIYEYILRCYQQVDSILGDLVGEMDVDTTLIIMSDHGFCANKKKFYVNKWLAENGFLDSNFKKIIIDRIKDKLGFKTDKFFDGLPLSVVKRLNFFNLQNTKAYFSNPSSYAIYINSEKISKYGIIEEGKEYNRIRHEIRNKLLTLRDEEMGKNIFENVYFREQIYYGPFLKSAPDLILSPTEGYTLTDSLISLRGSKLVNVSTSQGTHHQKGIFIGIDKKFIKNGVKINDINIIDIAPTVLYLMGLPVPSDMDGKVIVQMFEDSFLETNPIEFSDSYPKETEELEGKIYTEDEERQIRNSLKELGYLD